MAKNPPSRGYSESFRDRAAVASGRFWRNVVLIALAHVALIAGLVRWTLAARASSNPESIVWLGSAENLAAGEPENELSPPATRTIPPVEPKPAKDDEPQEEKPVVTTAKSEIELPSPTPNPTPRATPSPKPTASPTPKPKATAKPLPKPGRARRNPVRSQRKMRKALRQKPELRLRPAVGKQVQRGKVAMPAAEPAGLNLVGTATCFMIAFTAPGSSQQPTSLPAAKFRLSLKFALRKMGAFLNSRSSSRQKMSWSMSR